ncbi:hypothetical protein M406DRAFT_73832 [Cryphonectria parasitica EP155]|uniref:Uncharacterized protein n=1 Tax=Cryphonectria parasitica (strain ATCC 38755 / EP155) TaxID=660469 RepID=A0A9P4XYF9_CRYP1|nr:uncharacterized protein M406DRAFT_73832 [Cryphonectria parasitica EP155]KAF3763208.1 hypothetical protein M406DRAFT_73832 [Cryphonectria parasitica EP155]
MCCLWSHVFFSYRELQAAKACMILTRCQDETRLNCAVPNHATYTPHRRIIDRFPSRPANPALRASLSPTALAAPSPSSLPPSLPPSLPILLSLTGASSLVPGIWSDKSAQDVEQPPFFKMSASTHDRRERAQILRVSISQALDIGICGFADVQLGTAQHCGPTPVVTSTRPSERRSTSGSMPYSACALLDLGKGTSF